MSYSVDPLVTDARTPCAPNIQNEKPNCYEFPVYPSLSKYHFFTKQETSYFHSFIDLACAATDR